MTLTKHLDALRAAYLHMAELKSSFGLHRGPGSLDWPKSLTVEQHHTLELHYPEYSHNYKPVPVPKAHSVEYVLKTATDHELDALRQQVKALSEQMATGARTEAIADYYNRNASCSEACCADEVPSDLFTRYASAVRNCQEKQ